MPAHLFVYGTLMRGENRHRHLERETFVADVQSAPGYRLYDAGDYPALVEDPDGTSVVGELWLVSDATLLALDEVEGVDEGLYARRRIPLLPPQTDIRAEGYVYLESVAGLPDISPSWRDRPR
jgi:gamma-glutamylaminecyclotransferase